MKKVLLLFLAVLGILLGCTTLLEKSPVAYDAIIQLHNAEGRFYCSATVVSAKYAVTAAHCITEGTPIKIGDSTGAETGVTALPIRASGQMDYAVITGDFSRFNSITPELDTNNIINSFYNGDTESCGYPMGGSLTCLSIKDAHQYAFYFSANGTLYPGMSGGPVIDRKTKRIIGVNSAVYENGVLLAPIVNLLFGLNLNE